MWRHAHVHAHAQAHAYPHEPAHAPHNRPPLYDAWYYEQSDPRARHQQQQQQKQANAPYPPPDYPYGPPLPMHNHPGPMRPREQHHENRIHGQHPHAPRAQNQIPRRHQHSYQRHVHFELPRRHHSPSNHKHARPYRPDTPHHAPPPKPPLRPQHPHHHQQPPRHHRPRSPAPPPPPPLPPRPAPRPTIHLLSFSAEKIRSASAFNQLLRTHLPPATPHLYTISAINFVPPPPHLCVYYSGTHPLIQAHVMTDPRAQRAVKRAVDELLEYGRREVRRGRDGRGGKNDVALTVSCQMGTHRSVTVAERIRSEIERLGLGVEVRVVHVHRVRGVGDPW